MQNTEYWDAGSRYADDTIENQGFQTSVPIYDHEVRYSTTSSRYPFSTIAHSEPIENLLSALMTEWVTETQFSSSLDDLLTNASYLKIIEIGRSALPFIFNDLRNEPKPWFIALRKITGENPIEEDDAGRFSSRVAAWLNWAEQNGF